MIDSRASLSHARVSCDFEATCLLFTTEEDRLVGLEGRTLGSNLGILSIEGCVILLEALAFHISGNDTILNTLEVVADCVLCGNFALITTIEELTGVLIVL